MADDLRSESVLSDDIRKVLEYVSRGRGYVFTSERYPDAEARRALGAADR